MNHKELEQAVAAYLDPEPTCDIVTKWAGDPPMADPPKECKKCGEVFIGGIILPEPCTVPDPYPIPLTRKEDPDLYDKVLGRAIVELQKVSNGKAMEQILIAFDKETDASGLKKLTTRHQYKMTAFWWFIRHATPSQIWQIILKAKE